MHYYIAVLFWLHLIGITFYVRGHLLRVLVVWPVLSTFEPVVQQRVKDDFLARATPFVQVAVPLILVTGILQVQALFGFAYLLSVNPLTLKLLVSLLIVLVSGFEIRTRDQMVPLRSASDATSLAHLKALQQRETIAAWIQVGLIVLVFLLVGLLTS
jgi:hypothetical protein